MFVAIFCTFGGYMQTLQRLLGEEVLISEVLPANEILQESFIRTTLGNLPTDQTPDVILLETNYLNAEIRKLGIALASDWPVLILHSQSGGINLAANPGALSKSMLNGLKTTLTNHISLYGSKDTGKPQGEFFTFQGESWIGGEQPDLNEKAPRD